MLAAIGGGIVVGILLTVFEGIIYNPLQYNGNPFSMTAARASLLEVLRGVLQDAPPVE